MDMAGPQTRWLDDTMAAGCIDGKMKMICQMDVTDLAEWLTGWWMCALWVYAQKGLGGWCSAVRDYVCPCTLIT